MRVKNEARGDSKLNDSPALVIPIDKYYNDTMIYNIHEKILDSDSWLRAVQFKSNTPVQNV